MATKVFRADGGEMMWIQILLSTVLIVAAPFAAWEGTEGPIIGVIVPLIMFAFGAVGLWAALGMPKTIAVDDGGFLQIHSIRGTERIHATEIVEMRLSSTSLSVKLQKGYRYWFRNYHGLHEMLTLLKQHNPDIRLPGL